MSKSTLDYPNNISPLLVVKILYVGGGSVLVVFGFFRAVAELPKTCSSYGLSVLDVRHFTCLKSMTTGRRTRRWLDKRRETADADLGLSSDCLHCCRLQRELT